MMHHGKRPTAEQIRAAHDLLAPAGRVPIRAWFDGATEPYNPGGHTTCGWYIEHPDGTTAEGCEYIGVGPSMSNNCGEFAGAAALLEHLSAHSGEHIVVHGDSALVINILSGRWRAKTPTALYYPHYEKARDLAQRFRSLKWVWVPRAENAKADAMSMKPLQERGIMRGDYKRPQWKPRLADQRPEPNVLREAHQLDSAFADAVGKGAA